MVCPLKLGFIGVVVNHSKRQSWPLLQSIIPGESTRIRAILSVGTICTQYRAIISANVL